MPLTIQSLPTRSHGFSLLEVLIAIVVFSLGLLGLAGLQTTGLKNNYSAHVHAQAAQYAYDMADRMRTNRAAARAGNYNLAMTASAPTCGSQLAQCDLAGWLSDLATLPAGDGSVNVINDIATIRIEWNDSRAGGATNAGITYQTQL